jgi:Zn-dependent protease
MKAGLLKIGSPFGIPIHLHYTFWLIFFPVLFTLAQSIYPQYYADVSGRERWLMAALATALLLVSLVTHELGHALAARRFGIPVHSVELFMLGGAARMLGFTRRPRDEFLLAASGPLVSLLTAVALAAVFAVLRYLANVRSPLVDVVLHAAAFNVATVAFNLIPAHPLDGGRVLQGLLWRWTGRRDRAAIVPAAIGILLATALTLFGIWQISKGLAIEETARARQVIISGIWPIVIGAFVLHAARKNVRHARMLDRVSGLSAGQALDPRVQPVSPTVALSSVRQTAFADTRVAAAPVINGEGRALAILVESQVRNDPGETPVADVAEQIPRTGRVLASVDLFDAMMVMARAGDPWLVVDDADGRYVGLLTADSLHQAISGKGH